MKMGSKFKQGLFHANVDEFLRNWAKDAREAGGGEARSNRIEMQNLAPELREIISAAEEMTVSVEGFTEPQDAGRSCST